MHACSTFIKIMTMLLLLISKTYPTVIYNYCEINAAVGFLLEQIKIKRSCLSYAVVCQFIVHVANI